MNKFCVFCGEAPDGKTKEHVIPKWLIQLTGDVNREAFFGFIKDPELSKFKKRKYSFGNFTFPACDTCNNKYASLEGKTKTILQNILDGNDILSSDLSIFLDWLDKVRVGIWLGMLTLDKDTHPKVEPNFHIETRIGQHDRILIVEKSDGLQPKLNFGGAETFSFAIMPSAFVLIVNNYYFTNISSVFLFSRRLGFPFPQKTVLSPDSDQIRCDLSEGRERIMLPLLRRTIHEKGKEFYQPMFSGGLMSSDVEYYNSDYVHEHSMNHEKGIGNIFEVNNKNVSEYCHDDLINLTPNHVHNDEELFIRSAINVYNWQNWLSNLLPSLELLSPEQRKYVKNRLGTGIKINNIFIKKHNKSLSNIANYL